MNIVKHSSIAAIVIAYMYSNPLYAATYYVSPTGNDANNGITETTAFKNPQTGVDAANAGDTVIFLDGNYELTSSLRLKKKGTLDQPITIKSKNKHGAKIHMPTSGANDATIAVGIYDGTNGGWQEHQEMHTILDGLDVSGGKMHAIQTAGGGYLTIRNCRIHDSGMDGIKNNSGADHTLIENNEIFNTGLVDVPNCLDRINVENCNAEGIDITSSAYVVVRNNHIHTINGWGTYTKKGSEFNIIENNIIHDVQEGGIGLGESTVTYNSIARNNLIYNTQLSCLQVAGAKESQFYNNTCYNVSQSNGSNWAGLRAAPAGQMDGAKPGDDKYARNVEFKNNIIVLNNAFGICFKASDPSFGPYDANTTKADHIQQVNMDNNICYNLQSTTGANFVFEGKTVSGLDAWHTYTQDLGNIQDSNTKYADPMFISVDPANPLFLKLHADSPAINTGADLPQSVTIDYTGTNRPLYGTTDIGAYEYKISTPVNLKATIQ